jgi:serine/threonine-protein kinase
VIAADPPKQPAAGIGVPRLRGLPLKQARAELKQGRLRLGQVTKEVGRDAPRGTVLSQDPAPKRRVKPGTAVDVLVAGADRARRPGAVEVPDLVGRSVTSVGALLERSGLKLGRIRKDKRRGGDRNRVLVQTPQAGTMVRPGTAVDLIVLN